jgi:DNA-directed RNA polymerase sigma subunit (sigma70/sigma32)
LQRLALVRALHDDGLTFAEIGERLGVSRQRAQQVYADAVRRG